MVFSYKVIDNFFEKEDFSKIEDLILKSDEYNNVNDNEAVIKKFEENFKNFLIEKYKNKLFNSLNHLNIKKKNLVDYIEFTSTICGKNYKYPIHNDSISKVLSTVIYIHPQNNYGTFIYDDFKKNKYEISWKQNRAFIFSRKDKSTWHSYKSDELNGKRCTIIFTLRTNQFNKAYIIDRGYLMFIFSKLRNFFVKK